MLPKEGVATAGGACFPDWEIFIFPTVQLTMNRIGNLTRLTNTLLSICDDHIVHIAGLSFFGITSKVSLSDQVLLRIMQEGVFITPQEAIEPILNETLICGRSKPSLKALKSSLAFHNS